MLALAARQWLLIVPLDEANIRRDVAIEASARRSLPTAQLATASGASGPLRTKSIEKKGEMCEDSWKANLTDQEQISTRAGLPLPTGCSRTCFFLGSILHRCGNYFPFQLSLNVAPPSPSTSPTPPDGCTMWHHQGPISHRPNEN